MKFEISYAKNNEFWMMKRIVTENGYAMTEDCYWTQIFTKENGDEIILNREDEITVDPVNLLNRYLNQTVKAPKTLNVNINGNKKLQNCENVRFMIWNLPAVKTCPFRTEHCEKSCYARKAERIYPQVLPSREANFRESLFDDFVGNMIFTIDHYLNSKAFSGKKCVFRIHESGDFYNVEYAEKWVRIAKHFESDERIVFLSYTKSISYMVSCGYGTAAFPKNLVVRSSVWDDTCNKSLDLTNIYQFPIYTALTAGDMEKERAAGHKFFECTCENCATCGKCWDASERDIIVKIH